MEHELTSHSAILRALGSYRELSEAFGEPYTTVQSWDARDDIPSRVWKKVLDRAKQLGDQRITADLLTSTMREKVLRKRERHDEARAS